MLQFLLLKYGVMSHSICSAKYKIYYATCIKTLRYAVETEYLIQNLYSAPNYHVFLHVAHTKCIDMLQLRNPGTYKITVA